VNGQNGTATKTKLKLETIYKPGIAVVMGIIGGLSILGGIVLCVSVWPGDPGTGYVWKATAYTPALTWLFSGIISGVLFFACAAALTYLHGIREYAKAIAHSYEHVTESEEERQQQERDVRGEGHPEVEE
jgi:hypothetical protein